MTAAATTALAELLRRLSDETQGVNRALAEIAGSRALEFDRIETGQILNQNIAPELSDRTGMAVYPALHVYCDRISNDLREKFRTFSGMVRLNVEVRVSHDRSERLEAALHACTDAVIDVLNRNRGQWSREAFYTGTYEVIVAPVKRGGRNYMQSAQLRLDVYVSI